MKSLAISNSRGLGGQYKDWFFFSWWLTIFPCDVYKREKPFCETEVGTWVEKNNYLELLWVGQEYSYHLHDRGRSRSDGLPGKKGAFQKCPRRKETPPWHQELPGDLGT